MTIDQAAYSIVSDILEFLIERTRKHEYEPCILPNELEVAFGMLAKLARDTRTRGRAHSRENLHDCLQEMQRRHEWEEC